MSSSRTRVGLLATHRRRTAWISTALFAVLATAACQELVEPLAQPPGFEGTVTHISMDGVGKVDVALTRAYDGASFERAEFHLQAINEGPVATVFVREGSRAANEVTLSALGVGDRVEVWTTGVEMRSDPPQYVATQIVIVRD